MAKNPNPKRGDVRLVRFDPTLGAEIRKTRPALIIQNDAANRRSRITIMAAITSQFEEPLYRTQVMLHAGEGGLRANSVVLLNQIRSIDQHRLVRRLGEVHSGAMDRVEEAIAVRLGLVPLQ